MLSLPALGFWHSARRDKDTVCLASLGEPAGNDASFCSLTEARIVGDQQARAWRPRDPHQGDKLVRFDGGSPPVKATKLLMPPHHR